MNKEELSKLLTYNTEIAKELILRSGGSIGLPLVAYAIVKDIMKNEVIAPIEIRNAENRHMEIYHHGAYLAKAVRKGSLSSVDAVCVMTESWMSKVDTSKMSEEDREKTTSEIKKGNMIRPSKDPNRTEGLIVIGLTREGVRVSHVFEILKTWSGEKITVEFKDMIKEEEKALEVDTPLLDTFWKGYDTIDKNWEDFSNFIKNNKDNYGPTN